MSAGYDRPNRGRVQWPLVVGLTVIWVLLWGTPSVANVLAGLVISTFVMVVLPLPPIAFTGRVHPVGLVALVGWFVADLMLASLQVAGQVLRLRRRSANAVLKVNLHSRSDLYMTLTAELISLVPGSFVVEARRRPYVLFVHVLGVRDEHDVARARASALKQEARIMRAFASREEWDDYRRRAGGARV